MTERGKNPQQAAGFIERGDKFMEIKDYWKAFTAYNEAGELDLTNSIAWKKRADALEEWIGIKDLQRIAGFIEQGDKFMKSKDYEKAFTAYQEATRLDPNNSSAQKKSLSALERLLEITDIQIAAALIERGNKFIEDKEYWKAFVAYGQATQFDLTNSIIWEKRLDALEKWLS
jgi:tetratricopeptide (TPR) repeat protein